MKVLAVTFYDETARQIRVGEMVDTFTLFTDHAWVDIDGPEVKVLTFEGDEMHVHAVHTDNIRSLRLRSIG